MFKARSLHIEIDQKLSNQLESIETKSVEEIRKNGIDKNVMQKISADRAEMARISQEAKERMPGAFISLKEDKETRTFLFTNYQKIQVPRKDYKTGQTIPGKSQTKFRFQVYDTTVYDPNNPPVPAIWERGMAEADQVLYFLEQGKSELTIMRNGAPYSQQTHYTIYPANR